MNDIKVDLDSENTSHFPFPIGEMIEIFTDYVKYPDDCFVSFLRFFYYFAIRNL